MTTKVKAGVLDISGDVAAALLVSETAQATTSGTSIDFTNIPSWAKKITIMLAGVSTSGTDDMLIQIGDSGGIETTGYTGAGSLMSSTSTNNSNSTTGFLIHLTGSAATLRHGAVTLYLLDSSTFTWVASGVVSQSDAAVSCVVSGSKSLSAALDRVRLIPTGSNTFDAGKVNILYE